MGAIQHNELTQGLLKTKITIKNRKPVFNGLQSVLFPGIEATDQKAVKYKYAENGYILPVEGIRGTDPQRVNFGMSFNEDNITPAYFNPSVDVNIQEAENRFIDEDDADSWSLEQRQLYMLAEARQRLKDGFTMKKESLCASVLLTGSYTSKAGTFAFPQTSALLNISGANLAAKPVSTLTAAGQAIMAAKAGARPTMLIMNPLDLAKLAETTAFQKACDIRGYSGYKCSIEPTREGGFGFFGVISAVGTGPLEVYSYSGADNGTYFLPEGKAILCGGAVGSMGYAGVLKKEGNVTNMVRAVEDFIVATDENGYLVNTSLMAQTAPAPILKDIDGYGVITGITFS